MTRQICPSCKSSNIRALHGFEGRYTCNDCKATFDETKVITRPAKQKQLTMADLWNDENQKSYGGKRP